MVFIYFFVVFNLLKLANTLPDKEMLEVICAALLEHMGSERQSFATILLALRTLLTLTEHNYGVYHQKMYVYPVFATVLFFFVVSFWILSVNLRVLLSQWVGRLDGR